MIYPGVRIRLNRSETADRGSSSVVNHPPPLIPPVASNADHVTAVFFFVFTPCQSKSVPLRPLQNGGGEGGTWPIQPEKKPSLGVPGREGRQRCPQRASRPFVLYKAARATRSPKRTDRGAFLGTSIRDRIPKSPDGLQPQRFFFFSHQASASCRIHSPAASGPWK